MEVGEMGGSLRISVRQKNGVDHQIRLRIKVILEAGGQVIGHKLPWEGARIDPDEARNFEHGNDGSFKS
jgi:hypothetical protein